jgi:hypothetical protein
MSKVFGKPCQCPICVAAERRWPNDPHQLAMFSPPPAERQFDERASSGDIGPRISKRRSRLVLPTER